MTPVKHRRSGSVHDAVSRAFEEIEAQTGRQGIAEAAATLGVSQSLLYKASDPDAEGVELSLLRAGLLTKVYGIRSLADWLADLAGCDLVEREAAPAPDLAAVMIALGRSVQDFADSHVSAGDLEHARELRGLLQGVIEAAEAKLDRGAQVMPMAREGRS